MEDPLLSPSNQGTTIQTQIPDSFSNEVLTKLNQSSYLRIIPKKKNCIEALTNREMILSIYTISTLDIQINENENDNFLFKATYTIPCIPCLPSDFEVKCYTGSNLDTATDYFCSFFIKASCNFPLGCGNINFEDLKLKIAPKKLEINKDDQEIDYGRIERYMTCMRLNVRKFYDNNQSDFKYQIGKEDCKVMCTIPICNITCKVECPPPCIKNCGDMCKPVRTSFKCILDKNLNECGEYYIVHSPKFLCLFPEITYEIKFPNDANVSMKLLLLGGLIESIFLYYQSAP